jgi:hypothetical protein
LLASIDGKLPSVTHLTETSSQKISFTEPGTGNTITLANNNDEEDAAENNDRVYEIDRSSGRSSLFDKNLPFQNGYRSSNTGKKQNVPRLPSSKE